MRRFVRSPLTWMVVAELVVVGALIALAWNVIGSTARAGVAGPAVVTPPDATADEGVPPPDIPIAAQPSRGPMPGLNLTSAFWRARLAELNRDEAWLAGVEWRIVHAGIDTARAYVEKVVLPAVRRAERAAVG